MSERGAWDEGRRVAIAAIVVSTVTLLHSLSPARESVSPPADAYLKALGLYRSGRFADAARVLEPEFEKDPGNAGLASLLGWARLRLGRIADARRAFESATASEAGAADARVGLGYVSLREGKPDEAVLHFGRAVERDPTSVDAWKGLGMARWQTGDRKGAHDAYSRALALAPGDVETRELMAQNLAPGDVIEEGRPKPPTAAGRVPQVVSRA